MTAGEAWLAAGLVLLVGEVLAPGAFMMWLGIAAIATGALTLAAGAAFVWQVVAYAVLAAVSLAIGWRVRWTPRSLLNTGSSGLIGRRATVLSWQHGQGRVRLGDSDWSARVPDGAPDPGPGALLRVTGVAGTVLLVAPDLNDAVPASNSR